MTHADRSSTDLTRYDPVFVDTDDGGMVCRTITDDGQVFTRRISRERALRIISTLADWVART